jgi:hypothetical protein
MTAMTHLKYALDRRPLIIRDIEDLESRCPGWRIWIAASGSPVATRTGNVKPVNRARWQYTLFCESWEQLERELAEQKELDAKADGPWWDIEPILCASPHARPTTTEILARPTWTMTR